MAKHRLEQPARTGKLAKSALIAGSLSIGSLGVAAGAAEAALVTIPNVGTFEIPGISQKQIPKELRQLPSRSRRKSRQDHAAARQPGHSAGPRQSTGEGRPVRRDQDRFAVLLRRRRTERIRLLGLVTWSCTSRPARSFRATATDSSAAVGSTTPTPSLATS